MLQLWLFIYKLCVSLSQAMAVFFGLRELQQQITHQEETVLPLTPSTTTAVTGDIIDTG